jgi:hypothetical protein
MNRKVMIMPLKDKKICMYEEVSPSFSFLYNNKMMELTLQLEKTKVILLF